MFDFFREMSMELRGIDVEEVEAKRKAKLEEKEKTESFFRTALRFLFMRSGAVFSAYRDECIFALEVQCSFGMESFSLCFPLLL